MRIGGTYIHDKKKYVKFWLGKLKFKKIPNKKMGCR